MKSNGYGGSQPAASGDKPLRSSSVSPARMSEKAIYAKITKELDSGSLDRATWTKAFAAADGETSKTRAAYIRYRATEYPSASLATNEKAIYAKITEELDSGSLDRAIWTKAFAAGDGETSKTRAAYIRYRAAEYSSASSVTSNKEIYGRITDELESGSLDRATWTKAFATADGDALRTRAAYIRYRAAELQQTQEAPSS